MKKANVIRKPGLTIDVRAATVISDGVRLSAMPAVTEAPQTLAGSVRGATASSGDGSSERRLIIDQSRYRKPPKNK
jgi:hypothetical protein